MAVISSSSDRAEPRFRRYGLSAIAFAGWAVAFYGVLQFSNIRTPIGCALCGPWGCFPPLEALMAWHFGWLMILGPALLWLHRTWFRSTSWNRIGGVLIALATAAAGVVAARALYEQQTALDQPYLLRTLAMTVFSTTDFPIVPLLAVGLVAVAGGVWKSASKTRKPEPSRTGAAEPAASGEYGGEQ